MPKANFKRAHLAERHLLGTERLAAAEIVALLNAADAFKKHFSADGGTLDLLANRTVANLFFEDSTRTRNSFDLAARRLGAQTVNVTSAGSSMSKGESIDDTARTIAAMGIDAAVVRHSGAGIPERLTTVINAPIINAGDGAHEHPTQALLDAMTMREQLGDLAGKNIWIVGDITHSRVARSNIHLLKTLGAKVTVCGPRTLIPRQFGKAFGVSVTTNLAPAFVSADVLIMLRVQLERQGKGLFPTLGEYARFYGVTMAQLKNSSVKMILHPGPINRGVEIADDVADAPLSAITRQVANGVFVRMAVLHALCGNK